MKLGYKLLIILLLSTCVAPFFIKGPDNRPIMTLGKLRLPNLSIPQLPGLAQLKLPALNTSKNTSAPTSVKKTKIYKWQDKDGIWHFSDRKNPDGPSQEFYLPAGNNWANPNFSATSIGKVPASVQKKLNAIQAKIPSAEDSLNRPYSSAAELMQEARQVKKQLEDKYKEQSLLLK